jgi:hypothetical protein
MLKIIANVAKNLNILLDDAQTIRRCAMTLHRWSELECGDSNEHASWSVERNKDTGKPEQWTHYHGTGKSRMVNIPDRETGAIKRLDATLANYPSLAWFYQTDPRGASVYVYRKAELLEGGLYAGRNIDEVYSSVGVAFYK